MGKAKTRGFRVSPILIRNLYFNDRTQLPLVIGQAWLRGHRYQQSSLIASATRAGPAFMIPVQYQPVPLRLPAPIAVRSRMAGWWDRGKSIPSHCGAVSIPSSKGSSCMGGVHLHLHIRLHLQVPLSLPWKGQSLVPRLIQIHSLLAPPFAQRDTWQVEAFAPRLEQGEDRVLFTLPPLWKTPQGRGQGQVELRCPCRPK